jgi:hypothetical protein
MLEGNFFGINDNNNDGLFGILDFNIWNVQNLFQYTIVKVNARRINMNKNRGKRIEITIYRCFHFVI